MSGGRTVGEEKSALRDATVAVEPGELVSVASPAPARSFYSYRLYLPSSAKCTSMDAGLNVTRQRAHVRLESSRPVFQRFHLLPELARENVMLPMEAAASSGAPRRAMNCEPGGLD
jgi:predicted ABC-type transport system involved in lysophospholipase L1 biosynthesis ATPase subunit